MKKLITAIVVGVLALGLFATGVYASEKGWFNFEGEKQAEKTEDNIDEIMDILDRLNDGKISAEDAAKDLEKTIKDKNKTITELEKKLDKHKGNKEYIEHLESELADANATVKSLLEVSDGALKDAENY